MSIPITQKKQPSDKQHEIASLLLDLSGSSLVITPKKNAGYISLDLQVGKSRKNKNAVSVLRHRVSFMVPDYHSADAAKSLSIPTTRDDQRKKLKFPELTTSVIQNHTSFFQTMLTEAEKESRYRQEH